MFKGFEFVVCVKVLDCFRGKVIMYFSAFTEVLILNGTLHVCASVCVHACVCVAIQKETGGSTLMSTICGTMLM